MHKVNTLLEKVQYQLLLNAKCWRLSMTNDEMDIDRIVWELVHLAETVEPLMQVVHEQSRYHRIAREKVAIFILRAIRKSTEEQSHIPLMWEIDPYLHEFPIHIVAGIRKAIPKLERMCDEIHRHINEAKH